MLSTGLLVGVGGGALAAADSTSTTATGSPTAGANADGTSTSGSTGSTGDQSTTDQTATQDGTGTVGTSGAADQGIASGTDATTTAAAAAEVDSAKEVVDSSTSNTGSSASASMVTTASSTPTAAPTVIASALSVPAASSDAPASNSIAAVSPTVSPPAAPVSPWATALKPVTNAITTFANVVNSVPGRIAALPASRTPVVDVIMSVQDMLTTMAGAVVPLAHVPSDLAGLLGYPQTTRPLIGGGGVSAFTVDRGGPLFGPQAAPAPVVVIPTHDLGEVLFGAVVAPAPVVGAVTTDAMFEQLSSSGMASLAPEGLKPAVARSLFQHVVSAVLVPASLTALAALALPGVAGLLVVSAVGIRFGYRQAKAGIALRVAGIARFAGSGPLGVVRSGSLIALHGRTRPPRASRVVRAEAAPAVVRQLERVA